MSTASRLAPRLLAFSLPASLAIACGPPAPPADPAPRLAAGSAVEGTLAGAGDVRAYRLPAEAGWLLAAAAEQRGLDVALSLYDPRGRPLLAVDTPNGPEGIEELAVVAEVGGDHRLEVALSAGAEPGGRFRLRLEAARPATAADRQRAAAHLAYAEAATLLLGAPGEEDSRRALAACRDAEAGWTAAGRPRPRGLALRCQGRALVDLGQPAAAARRFEEALPLLRAAGNGWDLAALLNDAGHAHRLAAEPGAAERRFREALEVAGKVGNGRARAAALNNLGMLHDFLGDLHAALEYYRQARRAWRESGDIASEAHALHNLAGIYLALGRVETALEHFERALESYRRQRNARDGATALTSMAAARRRLGESEEAFADLEEALGLRRRAGDKPGEAVTLDLAGTVLRQLERLDEAEVFYRQALAIIEEQGDRLNAAFTLANLGWLLEARGEPGAAREPFRRALALFDEWGNQRGRVEARVGMARAERRLGDLAAARRHLEEAVEIHESVRARLQSATFRRDYQAAHHDVYGALVDLLMELDARQPGRGHAERAFEIAERSRARGLLESLAGEPAAIPAPFQAREHALRARVQDLERRRLEKLEGGADASALDGALGDLLLAYETLQGEIRTRQGPAAPARPLTLAEIRRQVLDEGTLLLAYALGEERSFLWRVEHGGEVAGFQLPPRREIEELVLRAHRQLPRAHEAGQGAQLEVDLRELSRILLAPVADRLAGERLLILPDGALHHLPFAALPLPAGPHRGEPLLLAHEVLPAPSASVLALLRRRLAERAPAPELVAVVADPVFSCRDERLAGAPRCQEAAGTVDPEGDPDWQDLERSARDFGVADFRRLRQTGREAAAILDFAARLGDRGGLAALGFEADRDLLRGGLLARYRILHFATHGLINESHPELSGLLLSLFDEAGRRRPGLLWSHELAGLHLPADLVVLSACRTALGREVRGEGLVGLAQGFFAAGAARLVLSYWNVSDEGAAELMIRFYRHHLAAGLPAAAALRRAQLSMLAEERWQAPYHWAAFTLVGEWR